MRIFDAIDNPDDIDVPMRPTVAAAAVAVEAAAIAKELKKVIAHPSTLKKGWAPAANLRILAATGEPMERSATWMAAAAKSPLSTRSMVKRCWAMAFVNSSKFAAVDEPTKTKTAVISTKKTSMRRKEGEEEKEKTHEREGKKREKSYLSLVSEDLRKEKDEVRFLPSLHHRK